MQGKYGSVRDGLEATWPMFEAAEGEPYYSDAKWAYRDLCDTLYASLHDGLQLGPLHSMPLESLPPKLLQVDQSQINPIQGF